MITLRTAAAFACAIALSACGQPAAPAAQTAEAPAAAAPAAAPAAPTVSAAQIAGRWGDNGDCTKDITFNADGSFRSYTGGAGTWTLDGDVMSMTGAAGTFQVRVALIDNNTLMIGNADGSYGISQRCP